MLQPSGPATRRRRPIALLAVTSILVIMTTACVGRKATVAGPSTARNEPARANSLGLPTAGASGGASLSLPAVPNTTGAGSPGQSGVGGVVAPAQAQVVRVAGVIVAVSRGNVPASYDAAANLATANGGFVAESNLSTAQGAAPSGRLTLRIPVDHLGTVLAALGKLGKVTEQVQQGTDVTGQLVDLGARIKTLQAEEEATRTLLGRAQAIGDILQIQSQLFSLRTQVEQLSGQQSQLSDKATYATIAVQVVEAGPALPPTTPPRPKPTLLRAWGIAGHNIVAVVDGVALTVGWLAPLLIGALVVLPVLLWWRRRIGPQPAATEPAATEPASSVT